jgi:mono/diheme cytochrome c family protein
MAAKIRMRILALALFVLTTAVAQARYGIGRHPSPQEIAGWDIDILPDGTGLPRGSGTVEEGEKVFAESCVPCHQPKNDSTAMHNLVGGRGTLTTDTPVRTVGSYWPYATTLFDYIRRAMPFAAPQSLTADQIYALCAYILYLNDIVPKGTVMDRASLPRVLMPNRDGFIGSDPRPDIKMK